MDLTKIIFILSTYLITFLIVSSIRFFLEMPAPSCDNESVDRDAVEYYKARKLKKKGWRDYLHALFIILPNLFISAVLTYFIYFFYPFEPTIPNIVTIMGSIFGVLIASYFICKSI